MGTFFLRVPLMTKEQPFRSYVRRKEERNHGSQIWSQVSKRCKGSDARIQARQAEKRTLGKKSEESKTSHRHWTVQSPKAWSEGSSEIPVEKPLRLNTPGGWRRLDRARAEGEPSAAD